MKQSNYTKVYCVLLLSALLFLAMSCKVADAGATADDTTDGGGTTTPVTHTITIKANGGTLGSLTQIPNIADGATVPAPTTGLPYLADNEIAYWSTDADKYNTVFKFDNSKVTSDITIYPHYRLTLTTVSKLMEGQYVSYYTNSSGQKNGNAFFYQLRSSDSLVASCFAQNENNGGNYDLTDQAYSTELNFIKTIPLFNFNLTVGTPFNDGTRSYDVGTDNVFGGFTLSYGTFGSDQYTCYYGTSLKYTLSNYQAPDSNIIIMGAFYKHKNAILKLVNYKIDSSNKMTEFTYTSEEYIADSAGTYRFVKIN